MVLALHRATIAASALIGVLGAQTTWAQVAWAQDASAWDKEAHAAARLIAGTTVKSAGDISLRAGVEIKLDPGWKTYWRYPGDSGVPPTLDFSGSENIKSVSVLWPAPEPFADGAGGHSIGYYGDIILPLRINAKDATKPSSLHVKLDYAICANLCEPAQADLHLTLSGAGGAEEPALAAAETRVPRHVPFGAKASANHILEVRAVHVERTGARQRVVVDIAAPTGVPVELLVEGPTPDWALPVPQPVDGAAGKPGVRRFAFDLDGLPPGAHADGAALTFTVVSPTEAIEVATHLD